MKFMNKLWNHQIDAVNRLRINSYNGIVVIGTGLGKTRIATEVMKELRTKTLIVVPTIHLMTQWRQVLVDEGFNPEQIGIYYGETKSFNKITVAVINSICDQPDLDKQFGLLVCDEVHHLSEKARMFSRLLLNNRFEYSIGLTATIDKDNPANKIIFERIGRVIYEYKTEHAVKDDLLNQFSIINVGVDLSYNDKEYLNRLDTEIKSLMAKFDGNLDRVISAVKKGNRVAARTLSLISKRKQFYNKGLSKVEKAVELIIQNKEKKVIVFNEFVDTANLISHKLVEKGIIPYVYHSKLKLQNKKSMLSQFKDDTKGVLVSVKAVDEGLNVPEMSVGIIVGYNRTSRQAIQRLGRILRKQENKHPTMFVLYYKDTNDVHNIMGFNRLFNNVADIRWL